MLDDCLRDRLSAPLRQLCTNRDFLLFTTGMFVSATGLWIQQVAVGWLVLEATGSALALGTVGFARMVPVLVLSFPAGALADRFDRRRLLMATLAGSLAVATALAAATWLGLF